MPKKTQAINIDLTTFIALLKILLGIPVRLVREPLNEFTRLEKIIEQLDKLLKVLLLNWQNFNL